MPFDSPISETNGAEHTPIFEFRSDSLLLPEHTATDPANDFLAFGTSDEDLQF